MTETDSGYCATIKVSQIEPSRFNARDQSVEPVTSEKFVDLCDSIRSEGLIEPIVVRKQNGGFEAVAGTRRLRAIKHIGMKEVAVVVRKMNDNDVRIASLVENVHRDDLLEWEKKQALENIYLDAWDEWKPKDWYDIMPRRKIVRTGEVKIYDLTTSEGKLVLAKQYLTRLHNERHGKPISQDIGSEAKARRGPEPVHVTIGFRKLRERIGYAPGHQVRIIAGWGSGRHLVDPIHELPPMLRKQFEEDQRVQKLEEDRKKELAREWQKATRKNPPRTRSQKAEEATKKFLRREQKLKTEAHHQQEQERREEKEQLKEREKKLVSEPKTVTNPVRAREAVIKACETLFRALTFMDLAWASREEGERQAKSIQAKNAMTETTTFYLRERELASLQAVVVPTYVALGIFRDKIYESIEAERRKDELLKP